MEQEQINGLGTLCVQAGYAPKNGEARVLPIYQSTTFRFDSCENAAALFDLSAEGHMYSRISNPTVDCVEQKIAALEGGVGALLTSSGQAAVLIAVMNITAVGQNILCLSNVYGGTINLLSVTLKRFGIETRFITPSMTDAQIESRIDENTRLLYGETLANPSLRVLDIFRFAALAHRAGLPLFVDNTFPTPILCRPFQFGADVVIHSATKYMDGHAVVLAGAIVDGGSFDWAADGRYPELTTPDPSYHGVCYTERFGREAFIRKARVQLLRDLGCTLSPLSAFLLDLGLTTLQLRMERHCKNALLLAKHLQSSPYVRYVNYPALETDSQHELAKRYLPDGASGVISFGVKGGREAAQRFLNSLKLIAIVVHVADARSSALHPASTTHRQLSDEQLKAADTPPDLIRLSVGIEDADDLLKDLDAALAASQQA